MKRKGIAEKDVSFTESPLPPATEMKVCYRQSDFYTNRAMDGRLPTQMKERRSLTENLLLKIMVLRPEGK